MALPPAAVIFWTVSLQDSARQSIDDDIRAFARKRDGDTFTDAARRTGYDGCFTLELHNILSLLESVDHSGKI